jgi:hypothetical protein
MGAINFRGGYEFDPGAMMSRRLHGADRDGFRYAMHIVVARFRRSF